MFIRNMMLDACCCKIAYLHENGDEEQTSCFGVLEDH